MDLRRAPVLPNFFVIGANKAGTTSLYRYLLDHPQIFMSPVKEPSYFAFHDGYYTPGPLGHKIVTTRDAYERLFEGVTQETVVGEASTAYLRSRRAAHGIHDEIPDAKLVAVLRDPTERARSAHSMLVAAGDEPLTRFEDAIEEELGGCTWRLYLRNGFYFEGLSRYLSLFERDQVKVFLYEDLRDDPLALVHDIFGWLGVDATFNPDVSRQFNVSVVPKSSALRRAIDAESPLRSMAKAVVPRDAGRRIAGRVRRWNRTQPPKLADETRRRLVAMFEEDIRGVESLLGRDLSAWRTP